MRGLSLPLFLVVMFIFHTTTAYSTSQSCSCVNGECTCDKSTDKQGNVAGAASIASTGFGSGPSTYNSALTGSSQTGVVDVQSSKTGNANFQGYNPAGGYVNNPAGGYVNNPAGGYVNNPAGGFSFGSSVATSNDPIYGQNGGNNGGPVSSSVAVSGGGPGQFGFGSGVSVGAGGVSVGVPGVGVAVGTGGGVVVSTPGGGVVVGGGFPFVGGFPFGGGFAFGKRK